MKDGRRRAAAAEHCSLAPKLGETVGELRAGSGDDLLVVSEAQ